VDEFDESFAKEFVVVNDGECDGCGLVWHTGSEV
jgi:hypothetical protein